MGLLNGPHKNVSLTCFGLMQKKMISFFLLIYMRNTQPAANLRNMRVNVS